MGEVLLSLELLIQELKTHQETMFSAHMCFKPLCTFLTVAGGGGVKTQPYTEVEKQAPEVDF